MPTPADPALVRLLHALLLASDRAVAVAEVVELVNLAVDEEEWPTRSDADGVSAAFAALDAQLQDTGVEITPSGAGFRLRTSPELGLMIRRLWPDKIVRLSRAALESLSVVAYRQPVTRAEVEEVRGVDCGGILRSLLDRKLLRVVGRKDEPGRPLLYGTTAFFLETFSLPDLRSLPTLRDLEAMEVEANARATGALQDNAPPGLAVDAAADAIRAASDDPPNG